MRVPLSQWRHGSDVRRGLYWSLLEGGVVGAMLVCLEAWLVPLLQIRLGAPAWIIGLISLVPQIGVIGLSPLTGRIVTALGGPKRACLVSCGWQIAILALLSIPLHAQGQVWAIPLAATLICLFGLTGMVNGPAWMAWMGALIPPTVSGRYQGNRARLFHITKLVFAGIFAVVMHSLPAEYGPWGLQAVLATAVASRLGSLRCLLNQPVPAPRPPPRDQPMSTRSLEAAVGIGGFLRGILRTDIGRWTLAWASFQGGCAVAGPFFASYMVSQREHGGLALDPGLYSLLIYTSAASRIVFLPFVGRLVDLYGPRAMLRASFTVILLVPIAWATTDDLRVLVANEAIAGIAWAATECSIGSLLFTCHRDPARRAELVGYFNTVSAALVALGIGIGTLLIDMVPPVLGSRYHTIMLLSVALRLPGLVLAMRWLPGLRPLSIGEREHLVEHLPGAAVTGSLGRGLLGLFRRPQD